MGFSVSESKTAVYEGRIADAVQEERWAGFRRFFGGLIALVTPMLVAAACWAFLEINALRERISVIEATRYTNQMAKDDEKERRTERAALIEALSALKIQSTRIEVAVTSKNEKLERIEADLGEVKQEVKDLRGR